MPFLFTLSTTSNTNLADSFRSITHPSLILAGTTQRSLLRSALKQHKRLSSQAQKQNLPSVLAAVDEYLPYLLALNAGLSGASIHDEEIDVILQTELETEWRCPLASNPTGVGNARIKGRGLDFELAFVLHTKACISTLQARLALQTLLSSSGDRKEAISRAAIQAKDHLLTAESIHRYLSTANIEGQFPASAIDIDSTTQNGLCNLASAEATLMAILSQDPYPAAVLQSRDNDDREWMYKARDIPKVRASLCGRLAIRAAEYADRALSLLNGKIDKSLLDYIRNLAAICRGKACRFFAIDAELGGKVGDALAWIIAGKKYLGYKIIEADVTKVSSLSKLKMEWTQKREDKKAGKGKEITLEGGKSDESRALNLLEQEFQKTNDLVTYFEMPPHKRWLTREDQSPDYTFIR